MSDKPTGYATWGETLEITIAHQRERIARLTAERDRLRRECEAALAAFIRNGGEEWPIAKRLEAALTKENER